MSLIKHGVAAEDIYASLADDAPPTDSAIIVSLARFQKDREALLTRNTPLGVRLKQDQPPALLGEDVGKLSLIVYEFTAFRDGRPFSYARALRTRLGFTGELRAEGKYLYDQIAFLIRVGFDAFDLPTAITPELFACATQEMRHVYQPAADGRKTIRDLR